MGSNEFEFFGAEEGDIFIDKDGKIEFVVLQKSVFGDGENAVVTFEVKFPATNKKLLVSYADLKAFCENQYKKRLVTVFDILTYNAVTKVIIGKGELFYKNERPYCEVVSDVFDYFNEEKSSFIPSVLMKFFDNGTERILGIPVDDAKRNIFINSDTFKDDYTAWLSAFSGTQSEALNG